SASDAPILQLDTGGHMVTIRALAFAPDGRYLVSAGGDRGVRVWGWQGGHILRWIRGEAGAGEGGGIYGTALLPKRRGLAAGGYFGTGTQHQDSIRLYEFATGRLVGLLKGHTDVVVCLAFAPDGRHLLSGSGDKSAIIWNVERRTLTHHLKGHTAAVYAV